MSLLSVGGYSLENAFEVHFTVYLYTQVYAYWGPVDIQLRSEMGDIILKVRDIY